MENNSKTIQITISEHKVLMVVKDELFPQIEKIKKLMVDIQACRITYQLYSKQLNKLEKDYTILSKEFFGVVRKLETPDLLFESMGDSDSNAVAYFKFQTGFGKTISEGVGYIEVIDRALDRKLGQINNNRTLLIALIAILIPLWQIIQPINIGNICYGSTSVGDRLTHRDCKFVFRIGTIVDMNWDTSYDIK